MRRLRAGLGCLALAGALLLSACGDQGIFSAAGPAARSLSRLGWLVVIVFAVVTVLMWALIWRVATRRRGTLAEHEAADAEGGMTWILVGGFAVPAAILAIVFVATLQTMGAFPMAHGADDPQIRVIGRQWWFQVEYRMGGLHEWVQTTTEIHIPVGRPVEIALESRDVIHSFWVPRLHGKVDLVPGMVNQIRLQADEPGVYSGQCAEYCGMQHANMRILVVAQPDDEFEAWLAAQRQPAAAPSSPAAERGRHHFESTACALCHTVRGTAARGTVGPDLTHVASRERIAGGMLRNNTANLSAWITHAQSLKPGAQMPDLTMYTGQELRDLVAYLQDLR